MADEPERRVIGVLAAALEQEQWLHQLNGPDTDGVVEVRGMIDLTLLAKAVLKELEQ